ncbi:MAG: phosphoglycerate kinase [Rhodospirillaceae bacterium]|nr:phosphoglycerate kinase [Rhodospirillaceae bacterium]
MQAFHSLDDLDVTGKTVLVRADLNVPMNGPDVTDSARIDRFAPTAVRLAEAGARVVILSHFGRPKGTVVPSMSLAPLQYPLAKAIGRNVGFAAGCVGNVAETAVAALAPGEVVLLENLRFHKGEEANDPVFARDLAALGDLYVNDAFSCAHRAHASTEGVARLLPTAAGLLMAEELEALSTALDQPERPVAALVGGAKVSTKLDVLRHLPVRMDHLIVGGGMANTFLFAMGYDMGRSLCERDMAGAAQLVLRAAESQDCEIILPVDLVVAGKFSAGAAHEIVDVDAVPSDMMVLDVGPETVVMLEDRLRRCQTMVWNGPLGVFELTPFDAATTALARRAAALTKDGNLRTVAGGGDTVAALANAGVLDEFSYVSTAGGAFLEWLEGKDLPGVAALSPAP